jgi:hypothetical protein
MVLIDARFTETETDKEVARLEVNESPEIADEILEANEDDDNDDATITNEIDHVTLERVRVFAAKTLYI